MDFWERRWLFAIYMGKPGSSRFGANGKQHSLGLKSGTCGQVLNPLFSGGERNIQAKKQNRREGDTTLSPRSSNFSVLYLALVWNLLYLFFPEFDFSWIHITISQVLHHW